MARKKDRTRIKPKGKIRRSLQITGTLDCHPDGYGFIRPDEEGRPDVYVHGRNMADAMHKDKVIVKVIRRKAGNKLEGEVVKILEHGTRDVIGFFDGRQVVPRDYRIQGVIWIAAKDRGGAKPGDIVHAKITRYPRGMSGPGGRIILVLGKAEGPEVETKAVLIQHGFKKEFPGEVKNQVANVPTKVRPADLQGRKDLRNTLFITIDPATAKDFDDAVAIKKTKAGYTLWISIADVSHYVPPMSDLDMEAYERATSVYFPDRAFPMLPHELSSGICSLNPRANRLAMTAEMRFDLKGMRKEFRFYASVIKSRFRLNYDEAKKIVADKNKVLRKKYPDAVRPLELMRELAELRIMQRGRRGSIDLDLPEAKVIFNKQGEVQDIARKDRHIAHRMIEEFMLSANEAVADFMTEGPGPFVYRIHEPPPPDAVESLDEFLGGLGIRLLGKRQTPDKIRPADYQRVLKIADNKPWEAIVNMLALRSMTLARYDTKNFGHFGLAAQRYCHFTSPIRRYPDLIVHRLLKANLGIRAPKGPASPDDIKAACEHSSERERAAEKAEREMFDYYSVQIMAKKIDEEFTGTVSGITAYGVFVQLDHPFVEGMIPSENLSKGRPARGDIIYDEKKHTLRSRSRNLSFSLGDRLLVEMEDVNPDRKQINFRFISKL